MNLDRTHPSPLGGGGGGGLLVKSERKIKSQEEENEDSSNSFLEDLAELIKNEAKQNPLVMPAKEQSPPKAANASSALLPSSVLDALLPKEIMGTLVLEALNGFMFLVDAQGVCQMVSDNVDSFLGEGAHGAMEGGSVFDHLHASDHARMSQNVAQGVETAGAAARVYTCRFVKQRPRRNGGGDNAFVTMQVSTVSIRPEATSGARDAAGRDLSRCRLFCVARQVMASEMKQYFPVELFTTKLEPRPDGSFHVNVVDTTGMNSPHAPTIGRALLNRCLVTQCCHPKDRDVLRSHLSKCLDDGVAVSDVYRLLILDQQSRQEGGGYVRVKSKSKFFKAAPGSRDANFLMSTHSVIDDAELHMAGTVGTSAPPNSRVIPIPINDSAAFLSRQQQNRENKRLGLFGGGEQKAASDSADASSINNNNLVKQQQQQQQGSPKSMDAQQKNLLLKQLLNVNFSRDDDSSSVADSTDSLPPDLSNSRILQLLSQHNDNVPASASAAATPGVKRPATSPAGAGEPSAKQPSSGASSSTVCKQNPSLTNLLAKPPHNSVAVPPPVPTKWHQEPREKLPRDGDGLRKFLPPHPAERGASATTTTSPSPASTSSLSRMSASSSSVPLPSSSAVLLPRTTASSSSIGAPQPNILQDLDSTLDENSVLSEILEGVIDIQEKSPGSNPGGGGAPGVQNFIKRESSAANISDIEKFLVGSEASFSGGISVNSSSYNRSLSTPVTCRPNGTNFSASSSSLSIQTSASSNSTSAVASNNNRMGVARQTSNPVSLVPRMNELLQVVPPNVSIPDCPDFESMVLLQQRRRSTSGPQTSSQATRATVPLRTSPVAASVPMQLQQQRPRMVMQQQQQQRPAPQANNLLMQQLNSAPLNQINPGGGGRQRVASGGNFPAAAGGGNFAAMPGGGNQVATHSVGGGLLMNSSNAQRFPVSSNQQQQLGGMTPQQQMMRGRYVGRPPMQQQQQPPQQQDNAEDNRSLLQQLLSE